DLYKYWDPINANSMVCAALEFVSATVLEGRKEVAEMTVRAQATNWPRYLRMKSGMAPGFSCTAFPISAHPDISTYIQALPDSNRNAFCWMENSIHMWLPLILHSVTEEGP
ncbi:hypothetical protein C8J57DRAFT_1087814, partial [Mycena rebaudengoi]